MEKDKEGYILKPNQEGGGYNYFGEKALNKFKSLSAGQRHHYILNKKIIPESQ